MPRYHFNVFDGIARTDPDGMELPHYPAARLEAVRRAGEILHDHALSVAQGDDWRIELTDDSGLTLFVMTFLVQEAPAVLRGNHTKRD